MGASWGLFGGATLTTAQAFAVTVVGGALSGAISSGTIEGAALGRKNWLFAGSERGGQAIAVLLSLIETAKANDLNPRTWLVDTLTVLPRWPNSRLQELLPLRQSA